MRESNLQAFYKYYSNATKEQVIEDMYLDCCRQQEKIENLQETLNKIKELVHNPKLTGIEAKLIIQDLLESEVSINEC